MPSLGGDMYERRRFLALVGAFGLAAVAAACGTSKDTAGTRATNVPPAVSAAATQVPLDTNARLTLYNAQHADLAEAWVSDFTKQTGIKVEMRSGKDLELANQ